MRAAASSRRDGYPAPAGYLSADGEVVSRRYDGFLEDSSSFSPNGDHWTVIASQGDEFSVLLDGEEGAWHEGVAAMKPLFSPDGESLAYVAKRGSRSFVVLNGEEQAGFDGVSWDSLTFSPDGEHLLYFVMDQDRYYLAVDGTARREIGVPMMESGIGFSSPDRFHYLCIKWDTVRLVEDEP